MENHSIKFSSIDQKKPLRKGYFHSLWKGVLKKDKYPSQVVSVVAQMGLIVEDDEHLENHLDQY
jgi:hypothetical protein